MGEEGSHMSFKLSQEHLKLSDARNKKYIYKNVTIYFAVEILVIGNSKKARNGKRNLLMVEKLKPQDSRFPLEMSDLPVLIFPSRKGVQ